MKEKIWLSSPHLTGEEQKYVKQAFDDNWVAPLGPNVNGLEQDICNYTGSKSCSVLSSGTAAIHLALILLGIEENDEVICSSFTFSASANPIRYQKAIPVFVDSEKDTWNMCPVLLEEAIKDRIRKGKTPKAIILVHLYGMPAKMDEILGVASQYKIPIIEDAAEALGAFYKDKAMGTFGELGIFSFNGNKIITTSGGGALVSDNPEYCKRATFLATQARDDAPHYEHTTIGFNYRMSNILAGIGRGQMEVLDDRVKAKRNVFDTYVKALESIKEIKFLYESKDTFSNRWLTTILLENYDQREMVRLALQDENIEARPLWKPMHLQPIFNTFPKYTNGISEDLFRKGLCLPSGSNMTNLQQQRVIDAILKLF
ncbi:DegT/DnrJ/EryC1/StrS family aminotransferase [Aureibaculum sp. A20]|uniref:DegT/DnrJ/EryC1/StrS family aminotransferase n=1 Tax=Aureibaculum flavum TaxID=2795986 RepID=A0ABS0WRI1_9FLAO|nr:DegT/DnrJ/EryC1/StrS family aminotransferase [Aureibaculum flavum]MBJ2174562.1 DegT/DnrJ/EryC1/StrS family aminotransferase [Aureibaculum flavum]